MRATRTPPIGPLNGRPASCVDADAALIATTSYRSCGFSDITVTTTWISLRRPVDERRAQRTVDQPAGEDRVRRRAALAAEERAGDAARGVHALLDVDRQREEVEAAPWAACRRRGGGQQHGLVVEVGDDGAGGLPGEAPGLEPDGAGAEAPVVEHRGASRAHRRCRCGDRSWRWESPSLRVRHVPRGILCRAGLRSKRPRRHPQLTVPGATTEDRRMVSPGGSRIELFVRNGPGSSTPGAVEVSGAGRAAR